MSAPSLEKGYNDFYAHGPAKIVQLRAYEILKRFGDWRDRAVDWYNDWVMNGHLRKKKQLYVYGPSNSGKTTFFDLLLGMSFLSQNK